MPSSQVPRFQSTFLPTSVHTVTSHGCRSKRLFSVFMSKSLGRKWHVDGCSAKLEVNFWFLTFLVNKVSVLWVPQLGIDIWDSSDSWLFWITPPLCTELRVSLLCITYTNILTYAFNKQHKTHTHAHRLAEAKLGNIEYRTQNLVCCDFRKQKPSFWASLITYIQVLMIDKIALSFASVQSSQSCLRLLQQWTKLWMFIAKSWHAFCVELNI